MAHLQEENERLRAQLEVAQWERDNALRHAVMLRVDYNSLKKQLNTKEDCAKHKDRGLQHHGLMTSRESRRRIAEEDARKEAKKQQAEAARSRRQEKEAAVLAQRSAMDGTEVYRGSLGTKTKADLETIALALGLLQSNISGTKAALISKIRTHLDDNPSVRNDQRFSGLFLSRSRIANAESQAGPTLVSDSRLESGPQQTPMFPPSQTPSCIYPSQPATSSSHSADYHGNSHTESAHFLEQVCNPASYPGNPSTSNGPNWQHWGSTSHFNGLQ